MYLSTHFFTSAFPWLFLVCGYLLVMLLVGWLGDQPVRTWSQHQRRISYALALAGYSCSWSFIAARLAGHPWSAPWFMLAIAILFPVLLWPLLVRIIRISHRLKLTSIADLLAARYGPSRLIASLVTLCAFVALLPYIAWQLHILEVASQPFWTDLPQYMGGQVWLFALLLASFTLLFGMRALNVTTPHPGLLAIMAIEAVAKLMLFALLLGGLLYLRFRGELTVVAATALPSLPDGESLIHLIGLFLLAIMAFICLPQQFQVSVLESSSLPETRLARGLLPCYLLVMALLLIPVWLLMPDTGSATASASALTTWLYQLSLLGSGSVMVIMAIIALATMVSNEWILPLLLQRKKTGSPSSVQGSLSLLWSRRLLGLVLPLAGALISHHLTPALAHVLPYLTVAAIAQLMPALLATLYWQQCNRHAVLWGLTTGLLGYAAVLLPNALTSSQPIAFSLLIYYTLAVVATNAAMVIAGGVMHATSPLESRWLRQLTQPTPASSAPWHSELVTSHPLTLFQLQQLAARFVSQQRAQHSFEHLRRSLALSEPNTNHQATMLAHTERLLSSVMGSASARVVLDSALRGHDLDLDTVAQLVEDVSSEQAQFSQALLQSAIENTSEGISVLDNELRLVAWNKQYRQLFNYPAELIQSGLPIETLIRYNVDRGMAGAGDPEQLVAQRMQLIRQRIPHQSERHRRDGRVIRIKSTPTPSGGVVMTYSDITRFIAAEQLLKQDKEELERRVAERTQQLQQLNHQLEQARHSAEQANHDKSNYLHAVSHDLLQPLDAARLFANALLQDPHLDEHTQQTLNNLDKALHTANELLADLAEVARIESGRISPQWQAVSLYEMLTQLYQAFQPIAERQQTQLCIHYRHAWTYSDQHLLRRIIQNLLANALQHTQHGRVLLCCRRADHGNGWRVEIRDNGPGIPADQQQAIFAPFSRLAPERYQRGLGLGLSIANGLAGHLHHQLALRSQPGRGSCFSVTVAHHAPQPQPGTTAPSTAPWVKPFAGITVLCIDNDPQVLAGMSELLKQWGCDVIAAVSGLEADIQLREQQRYPDVLLVDYQLDHGENGLTVIADLRHHYEDTIPAILITASQEPGLEQAAKQQQCAFLRKAIKPARLRALIQQQLYAADETSD